MIQIIPTLFSTTEEEYRKRLNKLAASSLFKGSWVQLDLMDNKFVHNLSIGFDVIKKYPLPYKKEAQLMVINPAEWIDGLIQLKVDRIIFPVEVNKIPEYINIIKGNQIEVGLSLNPETKVEELDKYLSKLDCLLLMAVKSGLEGQKFDPVVYEKIRSIKQKMPRLLVGVDGGVNDGNIKDIADVGADYVAVGSYLFDGDITENIEKLWEVIQSSA